MPRKAVIVSHQADIHAHAVRHELEKLGSLVRVIDLQAFTREFDLATQIKLGSASGMIRDGKTGESLDLASITGLWWRRPFPLTREKVTTSSKLDITIANERRAAIIGSLDAFVRNAFNDLGRSQQAAHKPTQLLRASRIGLKVPDTLITNNPEEAEAFIKSLHGRVVYKMLSGTSLGAYGTRHFKDGDFRHLDRLSTCPAIFQRYVKGAYDLRTIVIGNDVFTGRIDYDETLDTPDTRFVPTKVSPFQLPAEVTEKLVQLVQSFGLVYSAVDMRYSPEDGYVFFESNPEGQFLWIEIEADLPISAAIAQRLLK
ncbi:ATP-grasp domain-containing protein [Beijerinckia indica]|uniref:RimK domain protein ATP-grasp n=1 Tax=Beijerinckia indica subsp. indica (strain ATCC 9039 / DSM 1715 / NCIMB 8712) TaxID=395963 RepID=B2IDM9_BEII9|nr:RimK domain-containing protein [Beijerinckia indica]ACB95465.1 RimK domain protein ATP-grasp [Beijerinckia indica subsp. indica ATCC 9039]